MSLTVALTPAGLDLDALDHTAVVVIDVLRASTTILTALDAGARAVIPVADKGEAGRLAATLDRSAAVLGGERDGVTLPGFPLGNSPAEYTPESVGGRTVVLTTTNGTRALVAARGAARLAVGGFVNADAAARFLRGAVAEGLDAAVVCAGWRGGVALEDALCAGLLVDRLGLGGANDGARIAHGLYLGSRAGLEAALSRSDHARRLEALGAGADVARCARVDATGTLAVYRDKRLVAA